MANKKITQLDAVQEALGTDWLPVGREGSNQGTKVSIEQIEEYVEQTIKENASAGTSDDNLATIGYVNEAVANAGGGGTIEFETEINSVNPSNLKVPTSKAVADYVSDAVADAGGGTIELETEINSVNPSNSKVPTSKAVADYVSTISGGGIGTTSYIVDKQGKPAGTNLLTQNRIHQVNGFPNYSSSATEALLKMVSSYASSLYVGIDITDLPHRGLTLQLQDTNFRFASLLFYKKHIGDTGIEFPDGWVFNSKNTYGVNLQLNGSTVNYGKGYTNKLSDSVIPTLDVIKDSNVKIRLLNIPDGVNAIGLLITGATNSSFFIGSLEDYPQAQRNAIVGGITLVADEGEYSLINSNRKNSEKLEELPTDSIRRMEVSSNTNYIEASCPLLKKDYAHRFYINSVPTSYYGVGRNPIYNYSLVNRDSKGDLTPKALSTDLNSTDNIMPFAVHNGASNYGYLGGNHGFNYAVKLTMASAHDLDNTAIGNLYESDNSSYSWMPIIISSTTSIIAIPVEIDQLEQLVAYLGSVGSSGTIKIGSTDVAVEISSINGSGLFPTVMVSTVVQKFYIDGIKEVVGGEYRKKAKFIDYVVSYDVRDINHCINYMHEHAGNCDGTTWEGTEIETGMVPWIHTDQIWRMYDNGSVCIANRSYSNGGIVYSYSGGIQSNGNATGYSDKFTVPALQDYHEMSSYTSGILFNNLIDSDFPPIRYNQWSSKNNALVSVKTSGFYPFVGDAKPTVRSTYGSFGWASNQSKMYLSVIPSSNSTENIAFWCPSLPANQTTFKSASYYFDFEGNAIINIEAHEELDGYIQLPEEFNGHSPEPIEGDVFGNIQVGSIIVNGKLKCSIGIPEGDTAGYGSGSYIVKGVLK